MSVEPDNQRSERTVNAYVLAERDAPLAAPAGSLNLRNAIFQLTPYARRMPRRFVVLDGRSQPTYADWIKPSVIQLKARYVPFAGVVVVAAALERLLEPLVLAGSFGFFLLQSVASDHVNRALDLVVTGLAIGAGTKPLHDLITSIQSKG